MIMSPSWEGEHIWGKEIVWGSQPQSWIPCSWISWLQTKLKYCCSLFVPVLMFTSILFNHCHGNQSFEIVVVTSRMWGISICNTHNHKQNENTEAIFITIYNDLQLLCLIGWSSIHNYSQVFILTTIQFNSHIGLFSKFSVMSSCHVQRSEPPKQHAMRRQRQQKVPVWGLLVEGFEHVLLFRIL